MNNTTIIAMTEAVHAIPKDAPLEDQIRAAMNATRNHWMCTDETEQFKAAIGAVLQHYGEGSPEFARLGWEMRQIARLSAAMSGVPVDWTADEPVFEPIGIMGMWRAGRDSA